MGFIEQADYFSRDFGYAKHMVLSTCSENHVSSHMMSIIQLQGEFYFQTDRRFHKYTQLRQNPEFALCIDNIQVKGIAHACGQPSAKQAFSEQFQAAFPSAYTRYAHLREEVLFVVKPTEIVLWKYLEGKPVIEKFNFNTKEYKLVNYSI